MSVPSFIIIHLYVSVVYTFVACSSPQDEKQDQIPEVHVNAAKERNTMYPINIG